MIGGVAFFYFLSYIKLKSNKVAWLPILIHNRADNELIPECASILFVILNGYRVGASFLNRLTYNSQMLLIRLLSLEKPAVLHQNFISGIASYLLKALINVD
ncbi:hypothetical protein D3C81_1690930 [compost metagenome]